MNFLAIDSDRVSLTSRLCWEYSAVPAIPGGSAWSRASRRLMEDLRDEQNHRFLLRGELWLNVYPPRGSGTWRVEADALGPVVIGRGTTSENAVRDWRKRFQMTMKRYLELRPFEMTEEEHEIWARVQSVIDVPQYRATKPMVIRQVGKVSHARGRVVVEWEDGARETVNPLRFDEAFARFAIGQPFEAFVTRDPLTFRLLRADAVRKLPFDRRVSEERSKALWDRAVGDQDTPKADSPAGETDDQFWLTPSK